MFINGYCSLWIYIQSLQNRAGNLDCHWYIILGCCHEGECIFLLSTFVQDYRLNQVSETASGSNMLLWRWVLLLMYQAHLLIPPHCPLSVCIYHVPTQRGATTNQCTAGNHVPTEHLSATTLLSIPHISPCHIPTSPSCQSSLHTVPSLHLLRYPLNIYPQPIPPIHSTYLPHFTSCHTPRLPSCQSSLYATLPASATIPQAAPVAPNDVLFSLIHSATKGRHQALSATATEFVLMSGFNFLPNQFLAGLLLW